MNFQVSKGCLFVILAAFLPRSSSCSPTWSEQAPSSTGWFLLAFNIFHPKLSAGGTDGADVSPPYKGSEEQDLRCTESPETPSWSSALASDRDAGFPAPLHGSVFPELPQKSRWGGGKHACTALPVTAGGRLAYLWSQRFLLRLTDSQDPFAAWSLELISMRKGPPRTERCSRSSLQSCHTHPGFLSALA